MAPVKTRVIGIGNPLMGDDGVGCAAIETLQRQQLPAAVELVDGGCGGLSLLPLFQDCRQVILIDAGDFSAPPGTIKQFSGSELDLLPASPHQQLSHQPALPELLAFARKLDSCPQLTLLLVQVESCQPSLSLSAKVSAALDEVANHVVELCGSAR